MTVNNASRVANLDSTKEIHRTREELKSQLTYAEENLVFLYEIILYFYFNVFVFKINYFHFTFW